MSLAGDARSQGVVASPQLQRPAPGDAREHRYVENADGDDGVDGPGAEHGGDQNREQQGGKCKHQIIAAHDELVDRAAAGSRPQPQRHADENTDDHRQQGHAHRVLGAGHDHRQHVAAQLIGAEPVMQIGRLQLVDDGQNGRIVRRPKLGDRCCSDKNARDGRADDEADAARPGSIARSKDAHAAPACTGVLIRRRGCADADWPARRKGPPETSRSPPQTPARSRHSARRSDRAARWPGTPTVPGPAERTRSR